MEIVEENRHIAVNMEELLASYESLVTMDDLTRAVKPCVFEVPKTLYRHNKTVYLPKAFSFGPFHYGKPHLEAAQAIKFRFLQDMFRGPRIPREKLAAVERAVYERRVEIRQRYGTQVTQKDDEKFVDNDEFVKILVLDGCFIIRLFFLHDNRKNYGRLMEADPDLRMSETIIDTAYLLQCLYHDLILLENQIPWFVLELLSDLLYGGNSTLKLRRAAIGFFSNMFSHDGLPIPQELLEKERIEHILDLLRKSLFLSFLRDEKKRQPLDELLNMLRYRLLPFWKHLLLPLWNHLRLPPWKYLLLPLLVLGQLLNWLLECLHSLTLLLLKFLGKLLRAPEPQELETQQRELEMRQRQLEEDLCYLKEDQRDLTMRQPDVEIPQQELEKRQRALEKDQRALEKQQRALEMKQWELGELLMQQRELEMQIPSASRLREAGVKFKRGRLRLNIQFQKGVLEIPSLLIHDTTETILRNLIAFEQCYGDCHPIVTSYAKLMDNLIDTVEDIDILCKNGIICNSLNPEDATKFFNSLYNGTYISRNHYAVIYRTVNRYCQRRWPRWRAFYIHNYFGKPWAIFSQIFALIILALTILQVLHK